MSQFNTIELESGQLLLRSTWWRDTSLNMEVPPLSFWRNDIKSMIEWGREHFEGDTGVVLLPDGTLVFTQQVGRNSSHNFHIGQSQDGRIFRRCGGEESVMFNDLQKQEDCTYLGDCEFFVYRSHIRELNEVGEVGYWGHA